LALSFLIAECTLPGVNSTIMTPVQNKITGNQTEEKQLVSQLVLNHGQDDYF